MDKEYFVPVRPGELAIVLDSANSVIYSDFEVNSKKSEKPHLLDILGSKHLDLLKMVGMALDPPGNVLEADVVFRSQPMHLRAVHQRGRTHLIFSRRQPTPREEREFETPK